MNDIPIPRSYQITTTEYQGGGVGWLLLTFVVTGVVLTIATGSDLFIFAGVFLGFILAIVVAVVKTSRETARRKAIWNDHSYTWYRSTFPSCVTPSGRVTCRHCGSDKSNVRNLMQRTFMRLHACGQCGETLYFSAEKV